MKLIDRLIDKRCAAVRMENIRLQKEISQLQWEVIRVRDALRIKQMGQRDKNRVGWRHGTPSR